MTNRTWLLAAVCSVALAATPALAAGSGGSGGGNNNRITAGTTPSTEVTPGTATSPQGANPASATAMKTKHQVKEAEMGKKTYTEKSAQ